LETVKKAYHQLALRYHPDKNSSEDAKIKFQEVSEAYSILSSEKGVENNEYANLCKEFISTFFEKDVQMELMRNLIHKLVSMCEDKALKYLEHIDKDVLQKILAMIETYRYVLHISDEFLQAVRQIICNRDERIILHPFIDDLWKEHVFKLTMDDEVYLVPLWHHHLVYDTSCGELHVDCFPVLSENMYIDEYNHIHIEVEYTREDMWKVDTLECMIGSQRINIPREQLYMKEMQTYVLERQGIPLIHSMNIYDTSNRGNIYVYVKIV